MGESGDPSRTPIGDCGARPDRSALPSLPDLPDLMDDVVHRRRHAQLRARLFGNTRSPDRFGRYRLHTRLGAGATGVVYVAHDPVLDRRIALKILRDPGSTERAALLREARALATVSHPHVVEIFEVGECDGEAFIALELIDGSTLRAWAEQQPRSWTEVLDVYLQACEGLQAAHDRGLVHRDFKPDNAMIDRQGRVRVLDFGLARASASGLARTALAPRQAEDVTLTTTGTVAGTPAYLAPECLAGTPADARSDQFSLAISLYEALWGERPFAGDTLHTLFENLQANHRRPRPLRRTIPRAIDDAIDRALAPDPADRWPDLGAFAQTLAAARSTRSRRRRRRWWAAGALALVGSGIGWGHLASSTHPPAAPPTRCDEGSERLAEIWDRSRRDSLVTRWRSPEGDLSPSTQIIVNALDTQAEGWTRAWTETCASVVSAGDLADDGRLRCLERRRARLADLVQTLERMPVARLPRALPLVEARPQDDCTSSDPAQWLPADPERSRQVEDTWAALQRAMTRCRLEGPHACRPAIDTGLAEARRIDHPPLLAFALLTAGAVQELEGQLGSAEDSFEEAFFLARSIDHAELAARAANRLVYVVGYRGLREDDARRWVRQGEAALGDGDHAKLRGDLLNNRGLLSMKFARTDEARRDYLAALEHYERIPDPPRNSLATTLGNLAQVAYVRRDLTRALALLERTLALQVERFGADNYNMADTLNNRGLIYIERGDLNAAAADLQRALRIMERDLGATHPDLEHAVANLAWVNALRREHQTARAGYERALAVLGEVEADHPRRLELEASLAAVMGEQGHHERAREVLERILRRQQASSPVQAEQVALTQQHLGELLLRMDEPEHAAHYLAQAVALLQEAPGATEAALADPLTAQGEGWLAQGQPEHARAVLERAWSLRSSTIGLPQARGRTAFALARALAATAGRDAPRVSARIDALTAQAQQDWTQAGPRFAEQAEATARWRAHNAHDRKKRAQP
ncbi:MAG: serine/threonine-protein kinase [Myxococcota bacterium]